MIERYSRVTPVPISPCPACGTMTPRRLDAASKDAQVNYYRCPACGHVWSIDKLDPAKMTHVTPLRRDAKNQD